MTRRALYLTTLVVVAAVAGWLSSTGAAGAPRPAVLHVGDVVRIAGTSTKCAVAKRGGATTVECLQTKPTAGSYATLAGDHHISVVRFRSPHVAKTVFQARQHDPHTTTCR